MPELGTSARPLWPPPAVDLRAHPALLETACPTCLVPAGQWCKRVAGQIAGTAELVLSTNKAGQQKHRPRLHPARFAAVGLPVVDVVPEWERSPETAATAEARRLHKLTSEYEDRLTELAAERELMAADREALKRELADLRALRADLEKRATAREVADAQSEKSKGKGGQ